MRNELNLLLILICGIFIVIGVFITILTKNDNRIIKLSIGLTFGIMMSLIISDLLPKAIAVFRTKYNIIMLILVVVAFIVAGILLLKILDYFIPKYEGTKANNEMFHLGILSSIGIVIYNITEGIFLYRAFDSKLKTGILIALTIGLHNIPLGMIISSAFYRLKDQKKKFRIIVGLIAISTFIGALITYIFDNTIGNLTIAILLCITVGTLLYTIFRELIPQLKKSKNKEYSVLGIASGVLLFILGTFIYR